MTPAARTRISTSSAPGDRIRPLLDLEPAVDGSQPHAFRACYERCGSRESTTSRASPPTHPANVEFYAGVLGSADGEEDGQPGRPERLPPVLRRRARLVGRGHHVLRVPGRAERAVRATGWCTLISFRVAHGSRSILGGARRRRRVEDGALSFEDPEGLRLELLVDDSGDEPLTADAPDIPARAPHPRVRRRARVRVAARSGATPLLRGARLRARLGGARRPTAAASTSTTRRPTQRGLQAAGTVHHVAWASQPERARGVAAAGERRRRPARRR